MSKKIEKLMVIPDTISEELGTIWCKVNELIDAHNSTVVEDEWPKMGCDYHFVDCDGVWQGTWDGDRKDTKRRDILGIYRTREEAEATLAKIKEFLNK